MAGNNIQLLSVFLKDIKSSVRTRYNLYSLALFIVTTVVMAALAAGLDKLSPRIMSALLWVIMYYGSSVGLARSYVAEEERGTALLLKVYARGRDIFTGKLLGTVLTGIVSNLFACLFFIIFLPEAFPAYPMQFLLLILVSSIALGSVSAIISALITKASGRGALFPALSFPLLLPLFFIGIPALEQVFSPDIPANIGSDLIVLLAYCGTVITAGWLLFDFIWED